jgi:transcriptional regulator of acetoin/glycerol metabolism
MSVLLRDNDELPLASAAIDTHPKAGCRQPCAHEVDSPPRSGSHDRESEKEVATAALRGGMLVRFPETGRGRQVPEPPFMVARSAPMQQVLKLVEKLAPRDIPVLVTGETGAGKELVAASLHALSARASMPLIQVNCAAISHQLVEAELFGHARGAFTGAIRSREGYFGAAHRGTLVLDEVEALPLDAQTKLLRAVQHGEAQTVGTATPRHVDVRIIACTNVSLDREVNRVQTPLCTVVGLNSLLIRRAEWIDKALVMMDNAVVQDAITIMRKPDAYYCRSASESPT